MIEKAFSTVFTLSCFSLNSTNSIINVKGMVIVQKKIMIIISIVCCLLIISIILQQKTETAVKYFPIDKANQIEHAETNLNINNDATQIQWFVSSTSSKPMYLRQDIGLIFANGKVIGVQNEWKQHLSEIKMAEYLTPEESVYLEAISFHHGEIHHPSDNITSTQYMTTDKQYILKNKQNIKLMTNSNNKYDQIRKEKLKKTRNQQLHHAWVRLLSYYKIDYNKYHAIPLIELEKYVKENLPNQSRGNTEQIIGQLWEGLYQNYVLALQEENVIRKNQYMPLVLIAKDQSHLLVVYNLNGKNHLLKQKLPEN